MVLLQRMHYGIIALSSILVFSVFSYCIYRILQPRLVRVGCDNLLSYALQEKLSSYVGRKKSIRALGAAGLLREVQIEFPVVCSVAIAYKANQTAYIKLKAAEPLLLVKDCLKKNFWVLTGQGFIIPDAYNEQFLATKDTLFVYDTISLTESSKSQLLAFAHFLTHDFFLDYTVTWHNADKIVLQPTAYPRLSIIADTKTVTNNKLMAYALSIYSTNYREKPMKVDIRFGNFMVCARLRGDI